MDSITSSSEENANEESPFAKVDDLEENEEAEQPKLQTERRVPEIEEEKASPERRKKSASPNNDFLNVNIFKKIGEIT